ncbi:hypothetical protein RCL1_000627 [Eukaryota sp. TZLM3-RCL]
MLSTSLLSSVFTFVLQSKDVPSEKRLLLVFHFLNKYARISSATRFSVAFGLLSYLKRLNLDGCYLDDLLESLEVDVVPRLAVWLSISEQDFLNSIEFSIESTMKNIHICPPLLNKKKLIKHFEIKYSSYYIQSLSLTKDYALESLSVIQPGLSLSTDIQVNVPHLLSLQWIQPFFQQYFSPPPCSVRLEYLKTLNVISGSPFHLSWFFNALPRLRCLTVSDCRGMSLAEVFPICPRLDSLTLNRLTTIGDWSFTCRSLKEFKFENCTFPDWNFDLKFPNLRILNISACEDEMEECVSLTVPKSVKFLSIGGKLNVVCEILESVEILRQKALVVLSGCSVDNDCAPEWIGVDCFEYVVGQERYNFDIKIVYEPFVHSC